MPSSKGAADWEIDGDLSVGAMFGCKDRTVLITGGGSGIGSSMAAGFVSNGAKVYITGRKDTSELAAHLNQKGPGICVSVRSDVGKEADIASLVALLEKEEPNGVHAVINNAGTNFAAPMGEYSSEMWDKVYRVNTTAVFMLTHAI